jgi:hypothetical protein
LAFSEVTGGLCHNRGFRKFHLGRLEALIRFSGHDLGFQCSPLFAGFLNVGAALGKFLPFFPGHRLEAHGTVGSLSQLSNGRSDQHAVLLGLWRARVDASLGAQVRGRALRSRRYWYAAQHGAPTPILAMSLLVVNRPAIAADLNRMMHKPALMVARGIVVPK